MTFITIHNVCLLLSSFQFAQLIIPYPPLLIVYLFVQKYFEKGVMIGSVKG